MYLYFLCNQLYIILSWFLGTDRGQLAYFRACSCEKNHFRLDRWGSCLSCPAYGSCKNEILTFTDGYFVTWDSINSSVSLYMKFMENIKTLDNGYDSKYSNMIGRFPQAHRCLNLEACKIQNLTTKCVAGHKGFLCADCLTGYYRNGQLCSICPGRKETFTHISVTVVSLILLVIMVISLVLVKSNKNELERILSKVKICINYFYFSSKMYDIMTFIDWPKEMKKFIDFLKWLELNPYVLLSITCWLTRFSLYDSYILFLSVNGGIVLMVVMTVIILRFSSFLEMIGSEQIKRHRKCVIAVASISIFFLYIPTSISIVQLLPVACKGYYLSFPDKVEVFYFMQDPAMKCFTAHHNNFLLFVYVSLIYVFGIPVAIPVVIWYLRRKFAKQAKICLVKMQGNSTSCSQHIMAISEVPDVEDKIGENLSVAKDIYDGLQFFYANYKKKYFFWESIEMTKKMFLASVAVFIGEESYTAFALLIMFSGVFAVVHAHFQPIANTVEHFLQLVCLSALHIHLLLGLSMKMESSWLTSDVEQDIFAVSISLMICNIIFMALIFCKCTCVYYIFVTSFQQDKFIIIQSNKGRMTGLS